MSIKENIILMWGMALALSLHADFTIRVDETTQKYTVIDAGKPVLTYNYGIVPVPEGITGKYAVPRSNYIHPLYGPNGEVLTADYQKDHAHHRGIYWAWPEVSYKGEKRDLHALQGIFARPVRMIRQEATKDSAIIETEHVWKWGDTEEIVKEQATISVMPAKDGLRIIDFQFRLEGLKPDVTIARREQHAYGGFNVRMSARKDQQITKHIGNAAQFPQESWAELVGIPPEGKDPIGVFLLQKPTNPIYPCDWQDYPNLNWLQPTFPSSGMAFPLTPGKTLDLSYRVIIRNGAGLKKEPSALFASYAQDAKDPLGSLVQYKLGESRLVLTTFEESIRATPPAQRQAVEQRLLTLLAGSPSPDFKRWACRQLQIIGSAASIPIVVPYLTQEAWMEACDLLISLPGPKGLQAVLETIPKLEGERRATLIHAVGVRQDEAAIPTLAQCASDADLQTSSAALLALSKIQGDAAADALLNAKSSRETCQLILNAKLANAALQMPNNPKKAKLLFESVCYNVVSTSPQRGAALIGLATLEPTKMSQAIMNALASGDVLLRHAAAQALRKLDPAICEELRKRFPTLKQDVQCFVIPFWAEKKFTTAESYVIGCLMSTNETLKLVAVRALRDLGGASAIQPLLSVATQGGALAKEIDITLLQMRGNPIVEALKEATRHPDPAQSTLAVKALAARMDTGCIAFLLDVVAGPDTKKSEIALTTIKNQATTEALPQLRKLLQEKPELRESMAQAIIAICKRQQNPRGHLSEFLATSIKTEIEQQIKLLGMKNLASDKRITTSHPCQEPLKPELAIDGNPETYWSCAFSPSWIQVDLGSLTPVSRIKIVNFVDGFRYYQYRVEVSSDAKQWTCVGDMSQNTTPSTKEGVTHDFKEVTVQYVRVTMLKNSANPGMHISELSIYGVAP